MAGDLHGGERFSPGPTGLAGVQISRDQLLFPPLQQPVGMTEGEQHSQLGSELRLKRLQSALTAAGIASADPGRQVIHSLTAERIQTLHDATAVKLAKGAGAAAVSRQKHLTAIGLDAEPLHREPPAAAAAVVLPVEDLKFEMDLTHQPSWRQI